MDIDNSAGLPERIKTSFEALTEYEKDTMLKTLIVQVFNNPKMQDEFPILRAYAKYGAEAFDMLIDVEETKHTFYFVKKPMKEGN